MRLDHRHARAVLLQQERGRDPRYPAAEHGDVDLEVAIHRAMPAGRRRVQPQ